MQEIIFEYLKSWDKSLEAGNRRKLKGDLRLVAKELDIRTSSENYQQGVYNFWLASSRNIDFFFSAIEHE